MTPDLATMIAAAIPATTNPRRFVGIARIDDEEWALTDYPAPITGETPEVVAAQEALGAVLSERVGVRCDVLGVGRWENTTPTFVVQVSTEAGALDCADIVERAASLRWDGYQHYAAQPDPNDREPGYGDDGYFVLHFVAVAAQPMAAAA